MSICSGFDLTNTFADLLHENNCVAVTQTNGILCDLVQLITPEVGLPSDKQFANMVDSEQLDFIGCAVQSLLSDDVGIAGGLFQHEIHSLTDDIGEIVAAHIKSARTTVKPLVMSLAQKYQEYLDNVKPKAASSEFCIVNVKPAAMLGDELLIEEINYIENRTIPVPVGSTALEMVDFEQLVEMLSGTNSVASQSVREWVFSKPQGWLESLWLQYFVQVGSAERLPLAQLIPAEAADAALALYLWSKWLIANPSFVKANMTTTALQREMAGHMDYAASILYSSIRKIAQANSARSLALKFNSVERTLYVNGDMYPQWLEAGNSPEILLGMMCSGNIVENVDLINERASSYLSVWQQYCTIYTSKETNNRHLYSRRAIISFFNENLNEYTEEEKTVRQRESYFAQTRLQQAQKYLEGLTSAELENVMAVSLYLVAKIRFNYTSAYEILSDMEAAHRANPEIDPREAALMATLNYLGDFLAQNIAIKKF